MIIYELGARGFESHCSHLESFAYPKVSHKGSKGGGTVWHIWFLILLGTVLYWTNRFNPNKLFQRNSDCASENARYRWNFVKTFPKARYIFFLICSFHSRERQEGWEWRKVIHLLFLLVGGGGDGDMTEWWEISKIWVCALLLPAPFLLLNPCAHILKLVLPI